LDGAWHKPPRRPLLTYGSVVLPPTTITEGLQDLREGMAGLVSGMVQSNVRATQELLRVSDPGAVFDLQHRFMRDYLDALLQGTSAFIRVVRQTAEQIARPLEARIKERQQNHGQQRSGSQGRANRRDEDHVTAAGPGHARYGARDRSSDASAAE